MKGFYSPVFKIFTGVFVLVSLLAQYSEAQVTCYNDDSLDVINQDRQFIPSIKWPGTPAPSDCIYGPVVSLDGRGRVFIEGILAYDKTFDRAIEARISPSGVVAILTQEGSLYRYKMGNKKMSLGQLQLWFKSRIRGVGEFKLARNGNLIAQTSEG